VSGTNSTQCFREAIPVEEALAVALERAGAFCRVVAAGRAHRADDVEPYDDSRAALLTRRSASLQQTAEDLEAAASLWRSHDLV